MDSKDKKKRGIDPSNQLELLSIQCNKLSPIIYRNYALYLQIIRSILLDSVRNAILTLITGQGYSSFDSSNKEKISSCQLMVDKLVGRCNSLLTIEHIIDLIDQVETENKIMIQDDKVQLSTILDSEIRINSEYKDDKVDNSDIVLNSFPPIDNPSFINSWFIADGLGQNYEMHSGEYENKNYLEHEIESIELSNRSSNNDINDNELETNDGNDNKVNFLKSFFSIASNAFDPKNKKHDIEGENSNPKDTIYQSEVKEKKKYIPENPQALAKWINSFELALSRRLRNLSHALNVELLRAGIVNNVVPVSILDAVLVGEMSSQYSDSNLLKISIPGSPSALGDGIDIACLLIRLSDLEFDNPKLRNCRNELKKYQSQVLKMVRQQQHWQKRALAYELQSKWWQKPSETSPTNSPEN